MQLNQEKQPDISAEDLERRLAEAIAGKSEPGAEEPEPTARERQRPDVSDLDDAVASAPDGQLAFILSAGQRVLIDRVSSCLAGRPWLDTNEYKIVAVDQETGRLDLFNEILKQSAMSNFKQGTALGYRFLVPGTAGKWKKQATQEATGAAQQGKGGDQPAQAKKGRGRPPGVRNRPKEVIKAEKLAKQEERDKKRAARTARRRIK